LTEEFMRARHDNDFWCELNQLLRDYAGGRRHYFTLNG